MILLWFVGCGIVPFANCERKLLSSWFEKYFEFFALWDFELLDSCEIWLREILRTIFEIFPLLFARIVISLSSKRWTQFLKVVPACWVIKSLSSVSEKVLWKACVSVKNSAKKDWPVLEEFVFIRIFLYALPKSFFYLSWWLWKCDRN